MAEAAHHTYFFTDMLVFLFAAGILVPLLRLFKLPSVVSFIFAGVLMGPSGLGAVSGQMSFLSFLSIQDPVAVMPFAELGVLFLLFLLGLEFSFSKLARLKAIVFGAGGLQVLLSTLAISMFCVYMGINSVVAAIIGLSLSLSSTAVVMQIMNEQKRSSSPVGQTSLGVLLFQDILVAPILIFVAFTSQGSQDLATMIVSALIEGALAIAIIFAVGRFGLRRLFTVAAASGGRDFLMALTLLTVIGAAVLTASAGLSLALGAFLAGILLGETEFKHQTEVDLEPFKGVLLGLFFMTVGMSLDLTVVQAEFIHIIYALLGLIVVKFVLTFMATRIFTTSKFTALESALLLAPAGEFAFVIMAAAKAGGSLDADTVSFISAVVIFSMLLTAALGKLGMFLSHKLDKEQEQESSFTVHSEGHVIIAGYGRVGRAIAEVLSIEKTDFVVLDKNHKRTKQEKKEGLSLYLGDAARPEILKKAQIEKAAMFMITVDDPLSAEKMLKSAKKLNPNIITYVRACDADHAKQLYEAGADYVVPDAIEAGLQLAAKGLENFGYTRETVRGLLVAERDKHYKMALEE